MTISEKKMQIVVDNYFKSECDVNTSIRQAFEKGFRLGVKKVASEPKAKTGRWMKATGMMPPEFHGHHICSECGNFANMEPPYGNREDLSKFCPNCGAKMVREEGERCL